MSLLSVAKAHKPKRANKQITDEDIELSLAWIKSDIETSQVMVAWGDARGTRLSGNALYRIAVSVREGVRRGKIKLQK